MKKLALFILLFILINTVSFEYFINKASSTILTLLASAIFLTTAYFFIYKPLKNFKP